METSWNVGTAQSVRRLCRCGLLLAAVVAGALSLTKGAEAQGPEARIVSEIASAQRAMLPGSHPPLARAEFDLGRMPAGTRLEGVSMVFARSAAQEADLQQLLAAQQDAASPLYHYWLTPEEFAARFGMADADLSKVEVWLQQQGFVLEGRSRGMNRIRFSGSTEQVEVAFDTEMHFYQVNGVKHFAPATDLSIPAALSGMVTTVANLSTFRPKAHVKYASPENAAKAHFTSSQTGAHFLTPKDLATIYDITPAYNAGFTGTGQSIAVVGQSSVALSDVENFQSAAGLAKKDPTIIQVPNSGTAAVSTGDESESDLDLEYSGGTAPGATIIFVFVGNNRNFGVFDSLQYAIENDTAPVITISYGSCESDLSSGEYNSINAELAHAVAQGQTVVTADGDSGSTDCSGDTDQSTPAQEALAVDFPSSSQYVTAMGGTEFPTADVATTNSTFWTAASGTDVIGSAKSYIPEMVWNDDSAMGGLSSGGGGISTITPRPTWQTGVPGIPSGSFRLVPDISLAASPDNAGFLYCSSDNQDTGITGSCANGFRDSSDKDLTVAGGTSFDAPIFAGMVAIINQKVKSSGQGLVSSTLYKLAGNAATYASAFHDITSGTNECTAGATLCSTAGESAFAAGTGYDEASGLGSVDFFNLLSAWPGSSAATPVASTTTVAAATLTPAPGASDLLTITVKSGASGTTTAPTGTLTVVVDGTTESSSLALVNGAATFTFTSANAGGHTVAVTYSGDANYVSSSGSVGLTVGSAAAKSFTLSATNTTVAAGSSGTAMVTVTPANGYAGTVNFTVSPTVADACFAAPSVTVSGTSAIMATLTVKTSSGLCGTGAVVGGPVNAHRSGAGWLRNYPFAGIEDFVAVHRVAISAVTFAGIFLIGLLGLRSERRRMVWAATIVVAVLGGIAGCSSTGSSSVNQTSSSTNAAKGTYTLTVTGTDRLTASVKASTTVTLTID
jgi:subtilase family serine protease